MLPELLDVVKMLPEKRHELIAIQLTLMKGIVFIFGIVVDMTVGGRNDQDTLAGEGRSKVSQECLVR